MALYNVQGVGKPAPPRRAEGLRRGRRPHLWRRTFYVFVYEIAEDEVRYSYGLMGASTGQCLMSNIVRVVGSDEEGISI